MISRAPEGRSKVTNGRQLFIDGDALAQGLAVHSRLRPVPPASRRWTLAASALAKASNKSRDSAAPLGRKATDLAALSALAVILAGDLRPDRNPKSDGRSSSCR